MPVQCQPHCDLLHSLGGVGSTSEKNNGFWRGFAMGTLGPFHWVPLLIMPVVIAMVCYFAWRERLRKRGYSKLKTYLYELPKTDEQKLDAIELAIKGAVLCILGHLFPLFLLIGLIPLYYGARKLAAIQWGLAKAADEEHVDAAGKPESQSL
jgi:hypothetical protein